MSSTAIQNNASFVGTYKELEEKRCEAFNTRAKFLNELKPSKTSLLFSFFASCFSLFLCCFGCTSLRHRQIEARQQAAEKAQETLKQYDDEIARLSNKMSFVMDILRPRPNYGAIRQAKGIFDEKEEKRLLLVAIAADETAFKEARDELKGDKGFVFAAINRNPKTLQFVTDAEIVRDAVAQDSTLLQHASAEMKKNEAVVLAAIQSTTYLRQLFSHIDSSLLQSEAVAIAIVKKEGLLLERLPDAMKANKTVVSAAIAQDFRAFEYAANTLKNEEMVRLIIRSGIRSIGSVFAMFERYVPNILNNPQIIIDWMSFAQAANKYGDCVRAILRNLKSIRSPLLNNPEIIIHAIQKDFFIDPFYLREIAPDMLNQKEVIIAMLKSAAPENIPAYLNQLQSIQRQSIQPPQNFLQDQDVIQCAMERNGLALEFASIDVKNDETRVIAAIQHTNPQDVEKLLEMLQKDAPNMLKNENVIAAAIARANPANIPHLLTTYAPHMLISVRIAIAAVQRNGLLLEIFKDLQDNIDVVRAAVQQNHNAFEFIGTTQKENVELFRTYVVDHKAPWVLQYAGINPCADFAIVYQAVLQNGQYLYFASETLRKNTQVTDAAYEQTYEAYEYIIDPSEKTKKAETERKRIAEAVEEAEAAANAACDYSYYR